jgi:hypothetical protein
VNSFWRPWKSSRSNPTLRDAMLRIGVACPIVLIASWVFSWLFVQFVSLRMPSTAALGLPIACAYAALGSALGYLAAVTVSAVLGHSRSNRVLSNATFSRTIAAALLICVAGGLALGLPPAIRYDRVNRARIVFTTGLVDKIFDKQPSCYKRWSAHTVCGSEEGPVPFELGRAIPFRIACPFDRIDIFNGDGKRLATQSLAGLDPLFSAEAILLGGDPLKASPLAVLAHLRPTGSRDVLMVFDSSLRLVYQEILTRGQVRNDALSICQERTVSSPKLLVTAHPNAVYTFNESP